MGRGAGRRHKLHRQTWSVKATWSLDPGMCWPDGPSECWPEYPSGEAPEKHPAGGLLSCSGQKVRSQLTWRKEKAMSDSKEPIVFIKLAGGPETVVEVSIPGG